MIKELEINNEDCCTYNKERLHLGDNSKIREGVMLLALNGDIWIGRDTVVTQGCHIDGPTKIGNGCIIGPHTVMVTHEHDYDNLDAPIHISPGPVKQILIGNNCYIGARVTILQGVSIGDGTVIGAGSVVIKDIPSGVVAYGNPCKVRRKRGRKE